MIHPASRLEVVVHSRADNRNAVKSAAYCARSTYRCDRVGKWFRSSKVGGLLSHELINWPGDAASLWNSAESAEKRRNACVVREIRPCLPAELSLPQQIRLVRGFSLWLRDTYGVAIQADIHAPRFLDRTEERLHRAGKYNSNSGQYMSTLFDPTKTNRNFHAHILMTTRQVCPRTGAFGAKTRVLDDKMKDGPKEILKIRREWEKRTNAALKRIGSSARVDLRSYKEMAEAGDAPEGLVAQEHLGPRWAEHSLKLEEQGKGTTEAGRRRAAVKEHNEALWSSWLELQILERKKKQLEAEAVARKREEARKKKAAAERQRLEEAKTAEEAEVALAEATQFEAIRTKSALDAALEWAKQEQEDPACGPPDEFSSPVDLETYEPPPGPVHPDPKFVVRIERVRAPRSR